MAGGDRTHVLDDPTPLNGPSIDVASRVGWVLRMARLTTLDPGIDTRLRPLAEALGSSAAQLSRVENGLRRDGALVDGYERALGLSAGTLRAPIEILCRTFPTVSPPDHHPGDPLLGVPEMSELTERILSPEAEVTGGDWYRWARSLALPGNHALPARLFEEATTRLVHELARSAGPGYPVRYEALSLLRRSGYGHLVLDVARREVERPHAQGLADLMSAVGESATPDAVAWCLELLRDDRDFAPTIGALALENMSEVDGAGLWELIAGDLVATFDASTPGSAQEEWSAHVIRLVPATLWQSRRLTPARPLPPSARITDWSRAQTNDQWQICELTAKEMTAETGLPHQPLLARLLFDIAFCHWETRAVTSYMLLGALPPLASTLGERLAAIAESSHDPQVRGRVLRRLVSTAHQPLSTTARWLADEDPALRRTALLAAGTAGHRLPGDVLAPLLRDPRTARQAIYAAGMAGHPDLARWVTDETLAVDVRGALRWWLERGGRLVE